jgi:type II secretory pathway component GspD/PulD (secretin)
MFLGPTGSGGALVCLAAAAVVCPQEPGVQLPVTRLSGGTAADTPVAQTGSARPSSGQVPGLPVTRLDDRTRSADLDAPQRLTLSFAEPANVKDVLLLLVRGTPLSIALDPGINGTFVGELKEVTLRQAIELALAPNGLTFELNGSVIRVLARRTETRLLDLNFLNVQRGWQRTLQADERTALSTQVPVSAAFEDAAAGVGALLSSAGRVHVDRHAGLAQVTDYADRLDRVAAYIEALHLRGSRQVRLQARVLEVTTKGGAPIDWQSVRSRLGLPQKNVAAAAVVDASSFQSVLASQGDVQVVAAPELVTMNNEPAVVRTSTRGSSTLNLTVVPQISADGIVQLSLSPSWSSSGPGTAVMSVDEADTVVRVMDGSTVMLSGFLHGGKEVVVLLTPTVVTAAAAAPSAR